MSITKELREWTDCDASLVGFQRADLYAIADRIDVAHDDEVAHWIEEAHAEDIADIGDDELSSLYGLMRLPVDADGKTWRIGDEIGLDGGGHARIVSLTCSGGPQNWGCGCRDERGNLVERFPISAMRHYKPTPAERIRRWVDRARDDRADLGDLLAIAGELDGEGA